MPRIPQYFATPTTLRPDEKGYQALELEGRRVGPLYNQAAADIAKGGILTGQSLQQTGRTDLSIAQLKINQAALDAQARARTGGASIHLRQPGGGGGGGRAADAANKLSGLTRALAGADEPDPYARPVRENNDLVRYLPPSLFPHSPYDVSEGAASPLNSPSTFGNTPEGYGNKVDPNEPNYSTQNESFAPLDPNGGSWWQQYMPNFGVQGDTGDTTGGQY